MPARPAARLRLLAMIPPASAAADRFEAEIAGEIAALASRVKAYLRRRRNCNGAAVPAQITPLDEQGRPGSPCSVRLKDFTERSFAFDHRLPLTARRAMLSIDDPEFGQLDAEIDLAWCRYQTGGQYTSGGRFVRLHKQSA